MVCVKACLNWGDGRWGALQIGHSVVPNLDNQLQVIFEMVSKQSTEHDGFVRD